MVKSVHAPVLSAILGMMKLTFLEGEGSIYFDPFSWCLQLCRTPPPQPPQSFHVLVLLGPFRNEWTFTTRKCCPHLGLNFHGGPFGVKKRKGLISVHPLFRGLDSQAAVFSVTVAIGFWGKVHGKNGGGGGGEGEKTKTATGDPGVSILLGLPLPLKWVSSSLQGLLVPEIGPFRPPRAPGRSRGTAGSRPGGWGRARAGRLRKPAAETPAEILGTRIPAETKQRPGSRRFAFFVGVVLRGPHQMAGLPLKPHLPPPPLVRFWETQKRAALRVPAPTRRQADTPVLAWLPFGRPSRSPGKNKECKGQNTYVLLWSWLTS